MATAARLLSAGLLLLLGAVATPAGTYLLDVGGPFDDLLIGDGWYGAEGPYPQYGPVWHNARCRWARQGATLRLPVFPGVVNGIEIRAEVRGGEGQKLLCYVNGQLLAELPPEGLLHSFELAPALVAEKQWVELKLETAFAAPVPGDPRDLRVAVDWIKVTADAPARDFLGEALKEQGRELPAVARGEPPAQWKTRFDPNDVGAAYAPRRFFLADYDDSAWELVPTDHVPELRRGEATWYRAWVFNAPESADLATSLRLPGAGFETDGERTVWLNGASFTPEGTAPLDRQVGAALPEGLTCLAVRVLQGPLPAPKGPALIEQPAFAAEQAPDGVLCKLGEVVLTPAATGIKSLALRLLNPAGELIASAEGPVVDLAEGRRGLRADARWLLTEYGQHSLVVTDDSGRSQTFPLHLLGLHLFHWGWYLATGGTTWNGFKPCSNDYLDQLFTRMGEWDRPHHSICWGGAILAPGTGFHRTRDVDYIAKFRDAIAQGQLEFVGMPFPPRNICTDFGESLLRSMRRSLALYGSHLGVTPRRFYSHDASMTPQLPQIMSLCGYDTYCIAENWWGQGRSLPNSRDCYFRAPDGTQVRVLDSWYHGISPVAAARRAVQLGKPAVLCNEEFACLDRTVFLQQEHLDTLAREGIFLRPVSLTEYQRITDDFARQMVYEGDESLCYKGWTGGGEGEVEFEKANRVLESQLVALENLAAFARWRGIEVSQEEIDARWDLSLRAHECHRHWGNGDARTTAQLWEAAAFAEAEMARLAGLIAHSVRADHDGVLVVNPLGFRRSGLLTLQAPEGTTAVREPDGRALPLQPDPDRPGCFLASLPDLPSCGYRHYDFSATAPPGPGVSVTTGGGRAVLDNGLLRVAVASDARVVAVTDVATGRQLLGGANRLYLARPAEAAPRDPLSTESMPLNLDYYALSEALRSPEVVCSGPVKGAIECSLKASDYPAARITARISLVAGERQVRVRLSLSFTEPTVIAPASGPGPHEGVYVPGLFVAFPMPAGARPRADMAYCTTDGVLSSTNHETFLNRPFRNGTFNALSLAGPDTGEYAVLTRGLPDFFVVPRPSSYLGLSLGVGAANCPYNGSYVRDYALFVPADRSRDSAAPAAFLAARALLVEPMAVAHPPAQGDLPAEQSFVSAQGDLGATVLVPGVERVPGSLRFRVLNLGSRATRARIQCRAGLEGATVAPGGELAGDVIELPPAGVREVVVPAP